MALAAAHYEDDDRAVQRDGVRFTIRAYGPDARRQMLALVDISPHGLMAESDALVPGERLRLLLPGEGVMPATIRWREEASADVPARIGCRFDRAIAPAAYYLMLAEMLLPHDPAAPELTPT